MWFKQLFVNGLPSDFAPTAAQLEALLAARPLAALGAYDMQRVGWLPPAPAEAGQGLVHGAQQQLLIALGVEQKLLPAGVIRQAADARAIELAAEQGYPVGRRQMRDIKAAVADELRPRAFSQRRTTRAWIDLTQRRLLVDAATAPRAEEVMTALRDTLGTFNAAPLQSVQSPRHAMTTWLANGAAPRYFNIDEDLELRAANDTRICVRYLHHALDGKEIKAHLKAGMNATQLGLTWRDRVSFILTDTLQIKRVAFVGLGADRSDGESGPADERFENDFILMTGELAQLVTDLTEALGGEAQ